MMKRQWTEAEANAWYAKQGWLRGCNFIGSACVNRLDMYQAYKSEEKLANAEKELALCQQIGFNSVRLWANFDVYYAEPESYMEIFDKYIALCAKYGQKVVVVLTHEEHLPRGEKFAPKPMGEQKYALGVHQGILPMTEEQLAMTPYHYAEYDETRDKFYEMCARTVRKYAKDERVICWNIYNEPGITLPTERCVPILTKLFELVRAEDPIQPVCADVWRTIRDGKLDTESEEVALKLSDVISFHSYSSLERMAITIKYLQTLNRPVMLTEWLHRINHNTVFEIYPLLYATNVANYCWGFVLGPTQTNEPWDCIWEQFDRGEDHGYDFTKWQHDLFRPNLRPYDPREIAMLKRINALADKK